MKNKTNSVLFFCFGKGAKKMRVCYNATMRHNVNYAEIFARNLLQKFYFNGVKLYHGDNYSKRIPDIYCKNLEVGIEVAQAERKEDFLSNTKKHLTQEAVLFPSLQQMEDELSIFIDLTKDKIHKAQMGNYSGCKNLYLCIVSYYRVRDMKVVTNFVAKLKELGMQPFQKIFLIFSTSLFVVHSNFAITVLDYSDEEFEQILVGSQNDYDEIMLKYRTKVLKKAKTVKQTKQSKQTKKE